METPEKQPLETLRKPQLDTLEARYKVKLLERQLSLQGIMLEWLKAATVPAALIGVIATLIVGLLQVGQSEANRSADQLDKAVTRLAAKEDRQRMTGVAGVALFLIPGKDDHHASALTFLIDALAAEDDSSVRSAILGHVLAAGKQGHLSKKTLDAALEVALRHNRQLAGQARTRGDAVLNERRQKAATQILGADAAKLDGTALEEAIAALPIKHFVEFMRQSNPRDLGNGMPWSMPDIIRSLPPEDVLGRLQASMDVVEGLIAAGARNPDMSGLFCVGCRFNRSGRIDFREVSFSHAVLVGSDFSGLDLRGAKFPWADLRGTRFVRANLAGASLLSANMRKLGIGSVPPVPLLACANLAGSDLSNTNLLFISIELNGRDIRIRAVAPYLGTATFDDKTKLDDVGGVVEVSIANWLLGSDGYLDYRIPTKTKDVFKDITFGRSSLPFAGGPPRIGAWPPSLAIDRPLVTMSSVFQSTELLPAIDGGKVTRGEATVVVQYGSLVDRELGRAAQFSPVVAPLVSAVLNQTQFQNSKAMASLLKALPAPVVTTSRTRSGQPLGECEGLLPLYEVGLVLPAVSSQE